MEGRISTWTLLCLLVSGVGALQVNIPKDLYEYARGDNITLPCSFQSKITDPKLVIVTWSVQDKEDSLAPETLILTYYSSPPRTDIKQRFEGRVSVEVDVKTGKANLKLTSITLADNKKFECRILIPGDDEGKSADTSRLVVLVAPSTPICNIEGKAEYGQNINLTCKSEEGSPPPTYTWQNRNVKNVPRPHEPRTTDKGGILSLYNITKDSSGFYICTSRNKIRSAICNVTLSVMPPSMNIGSTAGIIGAVVAGLIVLIIVIYCCCCRKKKDKGEEYAMGVQAEEYSDNKTAGNGESRYADGQESDRDESVVRSPVERRDNYEEQSERDYDHRKDNYDRRSDYDDRRSDYDDRRRDYDDRRSDYDDRRSDYDDRRSDYNDRRSEYSDRRDRHERYDDDDRRRDRRYDDDDRYDEPYDERSRDRPPVPANKPTRKDYDD
ncbi:cell surface A33 antigen-like [Scomber japonicus]|uniref:cell surface A33 antigen-like n=1 Tax=Scomber japonicus TaxID=13676 RepID=UPI0023055945|nr:cell surface A33 antigen-like [Scomber japonicus]